MRVAELQGVKRERGRGFELGRGHRGLRGPRWLRHNENPRLVGSDETGARMLEAAGGERCG